MTWTITLAISFGCIVLVLAGMLLVRKQVTGSTSADRAELQKSIASLNEELEHLSQFPQSYISKTQFQHLTDQIASAQNTLESEKQSLLDIEKRLEESQKMVEEREASQQEMKSTREEDEVKLEELLAKYNQVTEESTSLEHQLANSLKNLDSMMEELTLTQSQRDQLQDLSNALTSSGAVLRDLLMEYESVRNRLKTLQGQHADLEEEYTKLVEQQLGE